MGELLLGYAPLHALVPIANIKAGKLPANAPLNSLLIRTISSVERQRLKRGKTVRTNDRVSITVRADSYDAQIRILDLVVDACADRQGNFAGALRASVLTAGRGPDLSGPGDSFEQAQDFKVSFDKPVSRGE
ncbi:hypothetical protein [Sphingomonas cynarae]